MVVWLQILLRRATIALFLLTMAFGLSAAPLGAAPVATDPRLFPGTQDQASGTVIVSSYVCDGLDTVYWGAAPYASCVGLPGSFSFHPLGDGGEVVSLQLDASGSGSVPLLAGTYDVYEFTATGSMPGITVEVLADETTVLNVLHPSGEQPAVPDTPVPEPTVEVTPTGWVEVTNYFCPGVSAVSLDGSLVTPECHLGDATIAFYLYGDGSDESWLLELGGDGTGRIELAAGTYAMVEQGQYTEYDFEVPAGQTVPITMVQPGSPAPTLQLQPGVVEVASYSCPDITEASYDASGVTDACTASNGTLVFRLAQGGTAEEWSLTLGDDGAGSIELAAGVYDVVEVDTWAATVVTVQPGATLALWFVRPAMNEAAEVDVDVFAYSCPSVATTDFRAATGDQAGVPASDDCTSSSASLTFTETEAATGNPEQVLVDRSTTIQLEPGTYTVVDERTQAKYELELPPAQNAVLTVSQPARGGTGTADELQGPTVQTPPESRNSGDNRSANASAGLLVTELPNVGAGGDDGIMSASMGMAAASVLSAAGGLVLRRR